MFDRFSDNSKRLMSSARREAIRLQHGTISPEHMLLGLLQTRSCRAVGVLAQCGVDTAELYQRVHGKLQKGTDPVSEMAQLPFTPRAKKVLELTLEKSTAMAHLRGAPLRLGTEHLLLGLLCESESLAARELAASGLDAERFEQAVYTMQSENAGDTELRQPLRAGLPPVDRSKLRLLLISNSAMRGGGYLEHCAGEMRDFLGARKTIAFVPYALHNHDAAAAKAKKAFAVLGHELVPVHTANDPVAAVHIADAVFVGGGNTFRLLNALYRTGLLGAIRERAFAGVPYVGSGAGCHVAAPSIRTAHDIAIVQPPSFTAMGLVPFQMDPHYLDPEVNRSHVGATSEERIRQYLEEHDTPVLGLREGCLLRVEGAQMTLRGTVPARLFRRDEPAQELTPPANVTMLLRA
jgi:dipeptidase E